jgi:hypothetical protein
LTDLVKPFLYVMKLGKFGIANFGNL